MVWGCCQHCINIIDVAKTTTFVFSLSYYVKPISIHNGRLRLLIARRLLHTQLQLIVKCVFVEVIDFYIPFFPAINRDISSCAAPEKLSVFLQRFPSKAVKTQVRRRIYSGTFYKFLQERRNVLLTLLRRNMYTVLSGEDGCSRHTDTIFTRGKRSLSCNELFGRVRMEHPSDCTARS